MDTQKLKNKRLGKYLGMGIIIIAPLFLFDQNIAVIDILPDFVAYLALSLGLRFFRDISSHFESAWRKFRILVPISIIKLFSMFWIMGGITSVDEKETMLLLVSFSLSVVELIYAIPAWMNLFEGFIYHSQTAGGELALRTSYSPKPRRTVAYRLGNVTTSLRSYTLFFVVAKAVLANICELAVLSKHTYDDTAIDWYDFIGLFRSVCIIVGMLLGLVWLCKMLHYLILLLRDGEFFRSAREKYQREVLPKTGLFVTRDIAFLLIIFCAALLFSADFYIDRGNAIPDVFCALLLTFFFIRLKPYVKKKHIAGVIMSVAYAVLSVIGTEAAYSFRDANSEGLVWKNPQVFEEFLQMYPLRVAENLLFAAVVVLALVCTRAVIRQHCGYVPKTMDDDYTKNRLEALHKELDLKVWVCLGLAVVSAIASGLYELMITFPNELVGQVWWMVAFLISGVLFAASLAMSKSINEEVESRYMLD